MCTELKRGRICPGRFCCLRSAEKLHETYVNAPWTCLWAWQGAQDQSPPLLFSGILSSKLCLQISPILPLAAQSNSIFDFKGTRPGISHAVPKASCGASLSDSNLEVHGLHEPKVTTLPLPLRVFQFEVKLPYDLGYQLRHFQGGDMSSQASPRAKTELCLVSRLSKLIAWVLARESNKRPSASKYLVPPSRPQATSPA